MSTAPFRSAAEWVSEVSQLPKACERLGETTLKQAAQRSSSCPVTEMFKVRLNGAWSNPI